MPHSIRLRGPWIIRFHPETATERKSDQNATEQSYVETKVRIPLDTKRFWEAFGQATKDMPQHLVAQETAPKWEVHFLRNFNWPHAIPPEPVSVQIDSSIGFDRVLLNENLTSTKPINQWLESRNQLVLCKRMTNVAEMPSVEIHSVALQIG